MTPNEHIEWFKRFAAAYLRWVNFNFDRIASDVIKKHSPKEHSIRLRQLYKLEEPTPHTAEDRRG